MFGKIVAGILGGATVSSLGLFVFTIAAAANTSEGQLTPGGAGLFFLILMVAALVVALTAPRAAKAWRRLLLMSAILSFAIPLSGLIFTGTAITQATRGENSVESAGAIVGTAIGGGMVTGALALLGLFMGLIFLVVGLSVGRDKQVIVVREKTANS